MIWIFGTNKNFDVKTAQRFFKERRIQFQFVDAIEAMTDTKLKDYASIAYLDDSEKEGKLLRQPVCRNGKVSATVGLATKTWEGRR